MVVDLEVIECNVKVERLLGHTRLLGLDLLDCLAKLDVQSVKSRIKQLLWSIVNN